VISFNVWTNFRGAFPAPEQVHVNVCFLGSAPKFEPPQFFRFFLWGHLKPLVYSARIENEGTLFQLVFYACQAICNCPGDFERMPIRT